MTQSLRIAIADDEPEIREFYNMVLLRLGHVVVSSAKDGCELVEHCRTLNPDIVISDIRMPIMDGIEAAHAIDRQRPVPIVLVSAYHDDEVIKRAEAAHVMGYLVKPVRGADL